jgi:transcription antitermination factor NusA-like protein
MLLVRLKHNNYQQIVSNHFEGEKIQVISAQGEVNEILIANAEFMNKAKIKNLGIVQVDCNEDFTDL